MLHILYKKGGCIVAVVKTTTSHTSLLVSLIRVEAEGDGELGMLMDGNVGVTRVINGERFHPATRSL